jgi:hypothetical protein
LVFRYRVILLLLIFIGNTQQTQQNPFGGLGGFGSGLGSGFGMPGSGNFGMPNVDFNQMHQLMQNPQMQQLMNNLLQNPEFMNFVCIFCRKLILN